MPDIICTREGCEASRTEKCLEGFEPLSTCPFLAQPEQASSDAERAPSAFVSLPDGEALNEIEASSVTGAEPTRVIILAGPVASGKTTILTSLYDAFLEAPFANFLFAGSRTLVGFERRSHDFPETKRTPISSTTDFLHLRVRYSNPLAQAPISVLLSDISGERFRALRDSAEAVRKMGALRRADYFTVIMDGEKLSDPGQRHLIRNDVRMLLRSVYEAGALVSARRVDLVVSKWDIVVSNSDPAAVRDSVNEARQSMEIVLHRTIPVRVHEVAARPTSERLPFAHGLATLFASWLEVPELPKRVPVYLPEPTANVREMSRFAHSVMRGSDVCEYYDVRRI